MPRSLAVLITYHDERTLLTELLESLCGQDGAPDEILIYDDCSQAPPEPYVPEVARRAHLSVLRGDTVCGPAHGRNELLRAAETALVHFHDADDLFAPGWCAAVRQALADGQCDAVFTEVASFDERGPVSDRVLELSRLRDDPDLVRFCLRGAMLVPSGTYRREAVLAIGGYRETLWQSEDFDFHVRLAASGIRFAVVEQPLVRIRLRAASRSRKRLEVFTSFTQALEQLAGELPGRYRIEVAEAAARAGSELFKLGAVQEANSAFALAGRIGPPRFEAQRLPYRLTARAFGPLAAERVGALYRSVLPQRLRAAVAGRGR